MQSRDDKVTIIRCCKCDIPLIKVHQWGTPSRIEEPLRSYGVNEDKFGNSTYYCYECYEQRDKKIFKEEPNDAE